MEDSINDALFQITKKAYKIKGVSRTDSGVHAIEQWATVRIEKVDNLFVVQRSLNALLAPHICIFDIIPIKNTDIIHLNEKIKTYKYQIFNASYFPVFEKDYYWFVPQPLDIDKMKIAAKNLIGVKNFYAFRNKGCTAKTTIRELTKIKWEIIQQNSAKKIHIFFEGNSFLKQMIRNIVGTLVDIGLERKNIDIFQRCFVKDTSRKILGKTAPANALFLAKVVLKSSNGLTKTKNNSIIK